MFFLKETKSCNIIVNDLSGNGCQIAELDLKKKGKNNR